MLFWFYRLPLIFVVLFIYAIIGLWTLGIHFLGTDKHLGAKNNVTKRWHTVNALFVFCAVFLVIYATLLNRTDDLRILHLQPFRLFVIAKENPEMYRSMLMNVALFVPLGVSFSAIFNCKKPLRKIVLWTTLFGMTCSVLIETSQYIFALGETELDDVICNTFGALLGALPPVIQRLYSNNLK